MVKLCKDILCSLKILKWNTDDIIHKKYDIRRFFENKKWESPREENKEMLSDLVYNTSVN